MECGLCFEIYNDSSHKPYSLFNCGHTYCISCINKLKQKNCPMCNQNILGTAPNFAILELTAVKLSVQTKTSLLSNITVKHNQPLQNSQSNEIDNNGIGAAPQTITNSPCQQSYSHQTNTHAQAKHTAYNSNTNYSNQFQSIYDTKKLLQEKTRFYQPHPTNPYPQPAIESLNESRTNNGINTFYESYEKRLLEIFYDPQSMNQNSLYSDIIFNKIEAKFVAVDFKSKYFIHSLVKVGCRVCLDVNNRIDRNRIRNYCSLLSIFINNNLEFQMEALLAIQAFEQQFKNLLESDFILVLFSYLYYMKIISEQVFIKWKTECSNTLTINTLRLLKLFFESLSQSVSEPKLAI